MLDETESKKRSKTSQVALEISTTLTTGAFEQAIRSIRGQLQKLTTTENRTVMKSRTFLILIFSFWLCSSYANADDLAALSGTCHNVTGNVDGHLKIVFSEEGDKLGGFVSVSGWLRGGGKITGTRSGMKFRFNTTDHTGLIIKWQGDVQNGKLSGEYHIDAQGGMPEQIGEWSVTPEGSLKNGAPCNANVTLSLLKMVLETGFNDPVKQADGTFIPGAQDLFKSIHPAGSGISIWVESLDVEWNADTQSRCYEDIHKFSLTCVLYWQGVLKPTGTTKLRFAYNIKLNAVTASDIVESTGTTNKDVNGALFNIGSFLGSLALKGLLGGK